MEKSKESIPVIDKVKAWLNEQGYPLEFRTAAEFHLAGIEAHQGLYVRESPSLVREIDVLARLRFIGGIFFEISIVVECKWSRDKPWVVFTTPLTRMAPSACIAQTMGSSLGSAVMHCLASRKDLCSFETFSSATRNGFGGRRAFTKDTDQDHFYSAVHSLISKARAYSLEFDHNRKKDKLPTTGCIVFPMIVVEGELYEAFFDTTINDVQLSPVEWIRLHWRGAEQTGQWISTLDIVKSQSLAPLLSRRKAEWEKLCTYAQATISNLVKCFNEESLSALNLEPAARGYLGLPPLLRELRELQKARETAPRKRLKR